MTAAMDQAMRDYVRKYMSIYPSKGGREDVTAEIVANLIRLRDEIRDLDGGGGMCGLVTEELHGMFAWERLAVSYLSQTGEVVSSGHYVSLLGDGTIVDPTADQFGEGTGIVILSPGEAGYGRYRPEFYQDFHPGTHPDDLLGWQEWWSGEMDVDAEVRLRKERGYGWWVDDVTDLAAYCRRQLELCEARGGMFGYDVYLRGNLRDLEGREPRPGIA